jgi:putative AlgH/UPF0301 family transcriptional regulator
MTTAAARSAALLRQFDASRQQRDGLIRHAPHCSGGPLVSVRGFSVTTTTCQTCKAVASVRHGAEASMSATLDPIYESSMNQESD